MRRSLLSSLLALFLLASPAHAQVTIPNTFSANTVAQSALVNANFSQLGQQALNRAGGIITGNISVDPGVTIDGIDISAVLGGTGTPTFSTVTTTGNATVGAKLVVSSSAADAIKVTGGLTAGSGNVAIIDTTGKIPALSSTYFASLSGANLTGIPEAALNNDSLLARVADNETVSGNWTVSGTWTFTTTTGTTFTSSAAGGAAIFLNNTFAAVDNRQWLVRSLNSSFDVLPCTDAISCPNIAFSIARSGSSPTTFTLNTAFLTPNRIAPTLANNNNNDWAPANFATANLVVATGATTSKITGIAGGSAGRQFDLCYATTSFTIEGENTNSSAANRFSSELPLTTIGPTGASGIPCVHIIYDGTSSRWRVIGKIT